MTENEAVALFKCLADKTRLQILKSLAVEDFYVERLSERLGLSPSTVSFHLKKLLQAGAVSSYKSQYYTMYSLQRAVFETTILAILQEQSDEQNEQDERDEQYRQRVLESFMEYGKLKAIPVQRKKKRIILEMLAEKFEPERDYTEKEVNLIIAELHDDFCTLRRDLISEQLMERDHGVYRRKITKKD